MIEVYYAKKMAQCQVCHSINTNGRSDVEGDTFAVCNECSTTDERGTTFAHEDEYIIAINPRWGSGGNEKKYMWPLNKKRNRR